MRFAVQCSNKLGVDVFGWVQWVQWEQRPEIKGFPLYPREKGMGTVGTNFEKGKEMGDHRERVVPTVPTPGSWWVRAENLVNKGLFPPYPLYPQEKSNLRFEARSAWTN